MSSPQFTEQQHFRQPLMWGLFVLLAAVLGLFVYGIVEQVVYGHPFGDKPAPDAVLVIGALVLLALLPGLFVARLDTEYTAGSIRYRWFPFRSFTEIRWEDVQRADVYRYGKFFGYGYRFTPDGTLHNTGGDTGLRLKMRSGRTLILGTCLPAELQSFLNTVRPELQVAGVEIP